MKMEQSKAQKKVFRTRVAVERLISFLDPEATLSLAESDLVNKETLRTSLGPKSWNQLIRRGSHGEDGQLLQEEDVLVLVKILKMIEVEDPSKFILPLLDHICKSGRPAWEWQEWVEMICPCSPEPHLILPSTFPLLELVEGGFGTNLQSVKYVTELQEPLLSAINSRISRMKEIVSVNPIDVDLVAIERNSLQAFTTLLQTVSFSSKGFGLQVKGAIGEEGWQMLARALRDKPDPVKLCLVTISRQGLVEARMEDLKDIYNVSSSGFQVLPLDDWEGFTLVVDENEPDWESAWTRLNEISAMTEDEFTAAAAAAAAAEEEHDDGEDEGEEEEVIESDEEGEEHDGEDGGEE